MMGYVTLTAGETVDVRPEDTRVVIGHYLGTTCGAAGRDDEIQAIIDEMDGAGYTNIRVASIRSGGTVDEENAIWIAASADTR